MGRDRRATDAAGAGRPSGVARDRLARRLRSDVADVRVRLEEAVLRSDALLAAGQPERAAAVLEEQHALLAELQETLTSSVAAAAVEAEAEAVLMASADGPAVFGPEPAADAAAPSARRDLRATASALVSAVAVLALLIVAAPTPTPDTLSASDARDPAASDRDEPQAVEPSSALADADLDDGTASERAIGPNELEVRRLFTSPSPLPPGRGDESVGAGLSGLQALVDSFVATVVRAAGELTEDQDGLPVEELLPTSRARPRSEDGTGSPRGWTSGPESGEDSSSGAAEESPAETSDGTAPADSPGPTDGSTEGSADEDEQDEPSLQLPEGGSQSSGPGLPPLE